MNSHRGIQAQQTTYQRAVEAFSYYQQQGDQQQGFHYLDSAATTQKPDAVIEAVSEGYRHFCAPVHRASYPQSESASLAYEKARATVAEFIGAKPKQLVFTRSCTESINQVAQGWAQSRLKPEHKIWISRMEHNANYLPWLRLCQTTGAQLCVIEMDYQGRLLLDDERIWHESTLLIAFTHCSNVLGGENPIQQVCHKARALGICTVVDAAQSVSHIPIDVQQIGCDFLTFSAHKMYGPEGIGALYIHPQRTDELVPLLMGGGIVVSVDDHNMVLREAPERFEAGSPNLSGALGFAAAVEFLQSFEQTELTDYIGALGKNFRQQLALIEGVQLLPVAGGVEKSSVVSFVLEGVHPHDVADIAAEHGVAMRTGNHCAHLLLNHLNLRAVNRVSLGVYNSLDDLPPLLRALDKAKQLFL